MIGLLIGAALFTGENPLIKDTGYWTNAFTEAISVMATVILIGKWTEQRAETRRIDQLKKDLVRNAGKRSNSVALDAIDDLRHEGWLCGENGLLKNQNLTRANLSDANLWEANLSGAVSTFANFSFATLSGANLSGAILEHASLTDAKLGQSNLSFALLRRANLSGADLLIADLSGADLCNADLTNAQNINTSTFDKNTILPDSTKWISYDKTDLARFTDPTHPNYKTQDELYRLIMAKHFGIPTTSA
jgi:hypothetical protein